MGAGATGCGSHGDLTACSGERAVARAMGVAVVDESSRRCALPGCEVVIEAIPGRPERRYCTAAHRSAARQARRASVQSDGDARLADALPWLREPGDPMPRPGVPAGPAGRGRPVPAPAPAARTSRRPVLRRRNPRPDAPAPRRRRALAVFGAAGVLVGGYAITASEPVAPPAVPVQAAPEERTEEQWAARAQVALSSVNRQLDTIAQAEESWNRVPQSRRAGAPPAPVRELQDRKALLERRKATLQSQLAAYRTLERSADDLKLVEQYLASVEKAIRDLPPEALRSPEQAADIAALYEERDVLIRRRDARRQELQSLTEGVQNATRTALPNDTHRTTEVSNEVLALAANPDGGPKPGDSVLSRRPDAVGGRDEEHNRPRAEVGTSGPPDPRGPRDETAERRGERGEGPVGAVAGAVGGVLSGGDDGGDGDGDGDGDDRTGDRGGPEPVANPGPPAAAAAAEPVGKPAAAVGTVADTADEVLPGGDGPVRPGPANRGGADSDGAAGQSAPAPERAAPPAPAEEVPAPRSAGSGGAASSVAGPMVRAMTPSYAAPYAETALRQADREAAARAAESGSGSDSDGNGAGTVGYDTSPSSSTEDSGGDSPSSSESGDDGSGGDEDTASSSSGDSSSPADGWSSWASEMAAAASSS
ncbi:hypothetical protein ACVGVM_23815 [Pseudonocardia bannensis]|uniref:Uncharacterized protein n=1 Tax=Pseudonocardia bannensis TaxID=630973 RepID=A0A848DM60_9PSEU|nr:hypothetical protein [Pseudonocardia bannensis]NMH93623.1 hypothetical protein [Pseudonocardia bannensis]